MNITNFSHSVIEKLQYYVYMLVDPINDNIFYIWKWKWNRIFNHLNWTLKWAKESDKINYIKKILNTKNEIKHYIIRHWLTEKEAFEVERSLIDFYWIKNLTNIVSWHNSTERWLMNVNEININYDAKDVKIDDNVILININSLYYFWISEDELYEVTRKSWVLNPDRASKAEFVLANYHWIVREVYKIDKWLESIDFKNVSKTGWKNKNRYEFIWSIAPNIIREKYIYKSIKKYWKQWSQNPIKYINI